MAGGGIYLEWERGPRRNSGRSPFDQNDPIGQQDLEVERGEKHEDGEEAEETTKKHGGTRRKGRGGQNTARRGSLW